MKILWSIAFVLIAIVSSAGECPLHEEHMKMEARAAERMGFDQSKTTHHFEQSNEGGTITITTNSPEDSGSRDAIRKHLSHIARDFAAGDFSSPVFIHQTNPPGVEVMRKQKQDISYKYEEVENGARVVITTKDLDAVAAIHSFFNFQIKEHHTGDTTTVEHH